VPSRTNKSIDDVDPQGVEMKGTQLRLLSAGAAQAVATKVMLEFRAAEGADVRAIFKPVGVLKEMLLAGEPCDIVVSTAAMLEEFASDGRVAVATISTLGRVHTGIAVRSGEDAPLIGTPEQLRASLAAATRFYVPDPERATAGIHFVKVLRALGLHDGVAPPIASYPNGASAMAALAATTERAALGCTQITEIKSTPGVALVGALPAELELVTLYAAAVWSSTRDPELARRFVHKLAGTDSRDLRRDAGFEV
jgi:molybdate transport system substrate-binding protein